MYTSYSTMYIYFTYFIVYFNSSIVFHFSKDAKFNYDHLMVAFLHKYILQ